MFSPRFDTELLSTPGLTVQEAVTRYLTLRVEEGIPAESDTYRHIRKHLVDRFSQAFGLWPVGDVQTDDLRTWLKTLRNDKTAAEFSPITLNQHVADLKVFFKRAKLEKWVAENPAEALKVLAEEEKDVVIMPVQMAFEFFKANRGHRAIGRLALESFGGLRFTTAGKLSNGDVKFEREGIEMPPNKHKSKKRKFRQGHPACLWEWLRHAPDDCWGLSYRQYREEKREMMILAGLRPVILKNEEEKSRTATMKNIWRHSFASYLLAYTKNPPLVAYLMQHTSMKTTQIYEGMCDEMDAALYLSITPATVLLKWDDFRARVEKHFVATSVKSISPIPNLPEA